MVKHYCSRSERSLSASRMRDQSTRTLISVAMNVLNSDSAFDGGRRSNSGPLLDIASETSLEQPTLTGAEEEEEEATGGGERAESRQRRRSVRHIFIFRSFWH